MLLVVPAQLSCRHRGATWDTPHSDVASMLPVGQDLLPHLFVGWKEISLVEASLAWHTISP